VSETPALPDPIFVTVKEAARLLSLTPWSVYRLLDTGVIDSRYQGRRRLVRLASLRTYADGLPRDIEDAPA
jgi:excisionase family DNA binding protein